MISNEHHISPIKGISCGALNGGIKYKTYVGWPVDQTKQNPTHWENTNRKSGQTIIINHKF